MIEFTYRTPAVEITKEEYNKWLEEREYGTVERRYYHGCTPMTPYFGQEEYIFDIEKDCQLYQLIRMPHPTIGEKYGIREVYKV